MINNDSSDKSNVKQAVPFFMVKNIAASIEYYVKSIGFQMTNKWIVDGKIRWCWLEIGQAALMLQEYKTAPREKVGEGVSIYFICEDALSIYKQILSRSISISEPFVGNNMWVVELTDPDGYKILFESPTDEAEETRYSEWINVNTHRD